MPSFLESGRCHNVIQDMLPQDIQYYTEIFIVKILPIAVMILCNVLNWRYFLKALQLAEQTLTATVLTSASNYVVSFILASMIYKEPITLLSTVGTTLIITGLWFLCDEPGKRMEKKEQKKSR
ncbi:uncharacterized protein LOC131998500 isoform X2 [Stomoxys calcitrans]|nr:uncharacterized protein LOC131998500 isoform X2 [Stomoxys calcitrans]